MCDSALCSQIMDAIRGEFKEFVSQKQIVPVMICVVVFVVVVLFLGEHRESMYSASDVLELCFLVHVIMLSSLCCFSNLSKGKSDGRRIVWVLLFSSFLLLGSIAVTYAISLNAFRFRFLAMLYIAAGFVTLVFSSLLVVIPVVYLLNKFPRISMPVFYGINLASLSLFGSSAIVMQNAYYYLIPFKPSYILLCYGFYLSESNPVASMSLSGFVLILSQPVAGIVLLLVAVKRGYVEFNNEEKLFDKSSEN